jgi:hypothetical protein
VDLLVAVFHTRAHHILSGGLAPLGGSLLTFLAASFFVLFLLRFLSGIHWPSERGEEEEEEEDLDAWQQRWSAIFLAHLIWLSLDASVMMVLVVEIFSIIVVVVVVVVGGGWWLCLDVGVFCFYFFFLAVACFYLCKNLSPHFFCVWQFLNQWQQPQPKKNQLADNIFFFLGSADFFFASSFSFLQQQPIPISATYTRRGKRRRCKI